MKLPQVGVTGTMGDPITVTYPTGPTYPSTPLYPNSPAYPTPFTAKKRYRVEATTDSGTIAAEADTMDEAVALLKQLQLALK